MVKITGALKEVLRKARVHLQLLADPVHAEQSFNGVFAIFDEYQQLVPGALRYSVSTGDTGPDLAILGGIHMNEMSGVYALQKFHERWLKGERPKCGNIYVATGNIERALEFIDTALNAEHMSAQLWSAFNATGDHYNYNRIPFDILTKSINNHFERHALQIIKHVLRPAKGRVLDLHNTSIDAAPMVTMFMQYNETPEIIIQRIDAMGVVNNLPIQDFIVWKPGPYNGVESIRSIEPAETGNMPILVENGGGANSASFDAADLHTQIWLKNITGMGLEEDVAELSSAAAERIYYVETHALYHPDVKPEDYSYLDKEFLSVARKESFALIRDWPGAITGWSQKAQQALSKLEDKNYSKNRLDNFMPINKGEVLAIGLNSGLELRSPADGVVMMVGASPVILPENRETFANIGVMLKAAPQIQ